jgi:hypothetical protein
MNRFRLATLLTLAVLWCAFALEVNAQPDMKAATAEADRALDQQELTGPAGNNAKAERSVLPADPNGVVLSDPESRRSYLTSMQRYYDYRANGFAFRSRVFEWQLLSSRIIFIVVLGLVGIGIYFASVQFRLAMRTAGRQRAAETTPSTEAPIPALATQLEVSAKGIVINSSVLGVVILGLSLAFFYLYLVHVYPIRDVL